jgi:hypothetical protein
LIVIQAASGSTRSWISIPEQLALIDDAIANRGDSMVVVTGDSDIQPAVAWVHQHYPAITLTIEILYECSRGLIITRESPPFEDVSKSEIRYVIGNGREVRFVFGSFDDLDTLRWDLENALI